MGNRDNLEQCMIRNWRTTLVLDKILKVSRRDIHHTQNCNENDRDKYALLDYMTEAEAVWAIFGSILGTNWRQDKESNDQIGMGNTTGREWQMTMRTSKKREGLRTRQLHVSWNLENMV